MWISSEISQENLPSTFRVEGIGSKVALSRWARGRSLAISAGCKDWSQKNGKWIGLTENSWSTVKGKVEKQILLEPWRWKQHVPSKSHCQRMLITGFETHTSEYWNNLAVNTRKMIIFKAFTRNSSTWYQLTFRSTLSIQTEVTFIAPVGIRKWTQ